MYPSKIPLFNSNLKLAAELSNLGGYFFPRSILAFQKLHLLDNFRLFKDVRDKLQTILTKEKFAGLFRKNRYIFPRTFRKHQTNFLINLWTKQCGCVLAQKIGKRYQMFNIYSKLREDKRVREIISRMKITSKKKSKEIMLGAVTLAAFEWDKYRIPEQDMKNRLGDLSYVYTLRDKTLCRNCHKKNPTENSENICHCDDFKSPDPPLKFDNWETFIEKKDLVVWRRLLESGHYEYKVYGSYNDVSAEEFLNVQVDTTYRRMWDTTAIVLDVVEKDPDPKNNSEVIYWEMLWPMMFANRDYVFIRRYLVDYKTNSIIMANRSIMHPKYPDKQDKFRVKDYWSYMVIKPYTELNKHGIEFVLTYYDNPGVSIPSKVTTWVAMRAMPDFLERLRDAAKKYKAYCKQYGVQCICLLKERDTSEVEPHEDNLYYFLDSEEDLITDNTISEPQHNLKKRFYKRPNSEPPKPPNKSPKNETETRKQSESAPPTNSIIQRGTKNFWKYLHPSYYIS
ncbi:stAR-related lipid transfer protein 7, mitochondrial-like [Coccinella septempunctata]|uniref:stAR-related lipid transfer protein 7, mitochondrial-like n=1 Tax=Coccinella septempunctata TaxID=41139 RepID=UPI001D080FB3|nr:stAR-related lipid transfer protein 7, mitochondrial-like [Coccinella septempunctata]